MAPLELTCLLYGDDVEQCFNINIRPIQTVSRLRELIREANPSALGSLDSKDFKLWKTSILGDDYTALKEFIPNHDPARGIFAMKALQPISTYFSSDPEVGCIHIIVQYPKHHLVNQIISTSDNTWEGNIMMGQDLPECPPLQQLPSSNPSPLLPPSHACKRSSTVSALNEKMKKYGLIQVRGTPGSGKTTLATLLAQHISQQEPNTHVIWVDGWPSEKVRVKGGWRSYLKNEMGWEATRETVFIFDEAQLSYEEVELWRRFFKNIHDFKKHRRAVTFASYGSAASRIMVQNTPIVLEDAQRVTLRPIQYEDQLPAIGLFFSRQEVDELVSRQYPQHYFDSKFFDSVFDLTQGHVGAIHDFIKIVMAHDSYRSLKSCDSKIYTWDCFLKKISPWELVERLENSASIFARGVPPNKHLKNPAIAEIFSAVLRTGVIVETDIATEDGKRELKRCFQNGWLHSDKLDHTKDEIGYFFPSPLHRLYLEWKLQWDSLPKINFQDVHILDGRTLLPVGDGFNLLASQ